MQTWTIVERLELLRVREDEADRLAGVSIRGLRGASDDRFGVVETV